MLRKHAFNLTKLVGIQFCSEKHKLEKNMIEIEMLIAQILKKKIYYAGYRDRREVDYFSRFK